MVSRRRVAQGRIASIEPKARKAQYTGGKRSSDLHFAPSFETATTVPMNTTRSYDSGATQESSTSWDATPENKSTNVWSWDTDFAIDSKFHLGLPLHNFQVRGVNTENSSCNSHGKNAVPSIQTMNKHDRCVLREIQREGLRNIPYLRTNEGYSC